MSGEDRELQDTEQDAGYPGALALDVEKYRQHVERYDISEEEKLALLRTLWDIMRTFAEIGWGIDNIQKFIPALAEFSSPEESGEVEESMHKQQFTSAASNDAGKDDSR